jgi:osmotically-inducible protein OsmY
MPSTWNGDPCPTGAGSTPRRRRPGRVWPVAPGSALVLAAALTASLAAGLLQGCAAFVVAGVATGASVVHDRRPAATVLADDTIEIQAMNLLHEHPEIAAESNISINSYNLVTLLTGQARTQGLSERFADLVARLPKVRKVVNEVAIGPNLGLSETSKDLYLASHCKLALTAINLPGFDPLRVHVVVSAGKVYLLGLVTREEATAVVEKVRYVSGVTQVVPLFEYIQPPA